MDRQIVYPGSIPLDTDILNAQRNTLIGMGFMAQALLGTTTVVSGLACTPTAPPTMTVNVGPGSVFSLQTVDQLTYGSLPADNDALVKIGINLTSTPFTLTAPTTSGQSINYLIEASFQESDSVPVTLPYYNAANPAQPYSGPSNSGTPQDTVRQERVALQLKAGAPANTGTQATPSVDSGWTGLWVITVNFGAASITSGSIAVYPNAPFLAAHLQSHHGGVPGQAPKINLANEVTGILPSANMPALGVGSLPFMPVQQGGGTGQLTNKVYIGYDGVTLRAQVDTTDWGRVVMSPSAHEINLGWDGVTPLATIDNAVTQHLVTSGANGTIIGWDGVSWTVNMAGVGADRLIRSAQFPFSAAGSGYLTLPSGAMLAWTNASCTVSVGTQASTLVNLPVAFPHQNLWCIANYDGNTPPGYNGNSGVAVEPANNSQVWVTLGAGPNAGTLGISILAIGW